MAIATPMYPIYHSPFSKRPPVENLGKCRSPSTFTRVSTHHLFLCEMFLASDALLGSTLDSKGLGGLWKQQTADEETSAPKVSLDDTD